MTTSGSFPNLTETLEDDPFGVAEFEAAHTDRFEQVTHALRNLTPFCHRLLTAIFYSSRSREELMEEFGYEAARVLATRKSQCLAKLRTLCGGAR